MKENLIKVKFAFGDNLKFDYFIIDEKSKAKDVEIEVNSIAHKIAGPGTYKVSEFGQIPFGNFDYVLEYRDKGTSNFRGLTLAFEDEIEK